MLDKRSTGWISTLFLPLLRVSRVTLTYPLFPTFFKRFLHCGSPELKQFLTSFKIFRESGFIPDSWHMVETSRK